MKIIPMALRSVGRNRARTIVTVGAMAFAGAIMIFYGSLIEGFTETMERNMVGMNLGDIQIHAKGYRSDPDLYKRIENHEALIEKLEAAGFNASPRLYGFGLAATESASSGVSLRGVDIKREPNVTSAHKHIKEGKWLDESDPHGVILGRKLARSLSVNVGDEVIIVGQAADGSMANDLYRVRGVLKSIGEGIDRAGFLMTAAAFRELFYVPEGVHEIALIRKDRTENVTKAAVRAAEIADGYETLSWRKLQPVIARILDTARAGQIIMLLIVYAAIGMVTLNAMLMSVFERIREFGIMKALGVSPWQVGLLVMAEAFVQTMAALLIAAGVGVPVSLYFQTHGINLATIASGISDATIGGTAIDPIWRTNVTFNSVSDPLIVLLIIVAAAVIYPGIKAAVIKPVSAIHHN